MSTHRQHPSRAQQPTSAPPGAASSSASDHKPLKWAFPFTPSDKADASDPMTYMKALAAAEDGFYPLGSSGIWHGGVHFDQGTAKLLKQGDGIRAIADGEVVAYRLDSKYPEQVYQDGRQALYSTGFVLIRHKLQLPPAPPKPAPANPQGASHGQSAPNSSGAPAPVQPASSTHAATPSAAARPSPDETLTFFSLYMHLMDWNSYQSAQEQARVAQTDPAKQNMAPMPYWEGERYYRVGDKANDSQEMPKRKAPLLVPTARGGADPLGAFIDAGFVAPQAPATDDTPPPTPVKGIRIRDLPNGQIIGILPKGAELTVSDKDPKHPGWQKIKALKSGQPVGAVAGEPALEHAAWSWVFVDELDSVIEPSPLDTVVVLKNPHKVQAGDVIGQFGHYLRYTDAKLLKAKPTRPLLHLEVFAGPELKAFIDKSRARAKELPAAKTFLEISPGARLVTNVPEPDQTLPQSQGGLKLVPVGAANASRWIKVQPKVVATADSGAQGSLPVHGSHAHGSHHAPHQTLMNVGSPVWVEAALANTTITSVVKGWTNFPLSLANAKGPGADFRDVFRRAELDKLGPEKTAIDDQGHHWWYIELGAKDGSIRQGWVCEENPPLVRMCGPWDWPGFDLVDNSSFKPVDMLKRYIYASEQFLVGEEQSEFEQSALTVNAGGLITQLEKAIDANHDGKVTAQELQHAQETPWTAEALSHLVVRSETEWGGGLGKWEELSPLMKKLLWLWLAEIERIGKLQWWEQATGIEGFPKEPNPWHFHPVGMVENFQQSLCSCNRDITRDELDVILPKDVKLKGLFSKSPNASVRGFEKDRFLYLLNKYMREGGITTCVRKVHFLSQVMHECDELRTNEEYRNLDGSIPSGWLNYSGGARYHGRGLIQITHDSNYASYGAFVGDSTIAENPEKISHQIDHTVRSACWYWIKGSRWGDINEKADKNDFLAVTVAVNGGFNNVGSRFIVLNKLAKLLGAISCSTNPGLIFSDYSVEGSSIFGTKFYGNHRKKIEGAMEIIHENKGKLEFI